MTRVLAVVGLTVAAALLIDVALFLIAIEHFDGDLDFGVNP